MIRRDTPLAGWIPIKVRWGAAAVRAAAGTGALLPAPTATVEWCFLGDDTFIDSFFEQTIERCWRRPFNQLFAHETPVESLLAWSAERPGIRPTAFIFHSSRCGSTLLAQMAAALPRTIVISEAPPVDQALRIAAADEVRIASIQALLSALGQPRRGDERHLFVKFDAWHVIDLAIVQRAFPDVPCLFLYREPAAVIASQLRMPGLHLLPGFVDPSVIGLDHPNDTGLARDDYIGRIFRRIYEEAVRFADAGRVALMNYGQLPSAAATQVLEWCGLSDSDDARERLRHVARFDAKTPSLFFDRSASPPISAQAVDIAARYADDAYRRLESIRLGTTERAVPRHPA